MLIRFVVENFMSFKEETEFNMLAGSYEAHPHHVRDMGEIKLLKNSAIYGPNGAGKSNFIKAVDTLKSIIKLGQLTPDINGRKFRLDKDCLTKPIKFEIELLINEVVYAYGLVFDYDKIVEEWLYEPNVDINKEDKLIFERKLEGDKYSVKLNEVYNDKEVLLQFIVDKQLKAEQLFLNKAIDLDIVEANRFIDFILEYIVIIYPTTILQNIILNFEKEPQFLEYLNIFFKQYDTGINNFEIKNTLFSLQDVPEKDRKNINQQLKVFDVFNYGPGQIIHKEKNGETYKKEFLGIVENHKNEKIEFKMNEFSDGTLRLLDYIPILVLLHFPDYTFIIDEMDRSIHPSLLKFLLKNISSESRLEGQLIFTTHESNLLDLNLFRQDEVWMVEKETGSSKMYSLSEYKPIQGIDLRKGYLKGRFGAIPFLADLENLNWGVNNA